MENKQSLLEAISSIWDTLSKISSIEKRIERLEDLSDKLCVVSTGNKDSLEIIKYSQLTKEDFEKNTERIHDLISANSKNIISSMGDIDEIKANYQQLEGKYQTADKERLQVIEECNIFKSKLEEANKKNSELSCVEEKVQILEQEKNRLLDKVHSWDEMLAIYQEIDNAFNRCEQLKGYLEIKGLNGEGEKRIFQLAIAIGQTQSFARGLYEYAKKMKKENLCAMNQSEVNVYDALNRCYRDACNINFDIFSYADHTSLSDGFKECNFNSNVMEDLQDYREKGFNKVDFVFVPAMRSLDGDGTTFVVKSIVRGKM